jgi:lysophospholipase L1-like esterase
MKVYVVGDSISIQYGPHLKAYLGPGWDYARKEGEEEALLNLDHPQGANGGDSSMVLAFLEGKARSGGIDADLLLVNCGLHDIKTDPSSGRRQVPSQRYGQNLRRIVQTVAPLRPELVWIRTTPCDEAVHNHPAMTFHRFSADAEAYNRVADRVMSDAGVPCIDLHTFTKNLGGDLYCDHVHFHDHVREKQAAFIAGWLAAYAQAVPAAPVQPLSARRPGARRRRRRGWPLRWAGTARGWTDRRARAR